MLKRRGEPSQSIKLLATHFIFGWGEIQVHCFSKKEKWKFSKKAENILLFILLLSLTLRLLSSQPPFFNLLNITYYLTAATFFHSLQTYITHSPQTHDKSLNPFNHLSFHSWLHLKPSYNYLKPPWKSCIHNNSSTPFNLYTQIHHHHS